MNCVKLYYNLEINIVRNFVTECLLDYFKQIITVVTVEGITREFNYSVKNLNRRDGRYVYKKNPRGCARTKPILGRYVA